MKKVILLDHSMGGGTATLLAKKYPHPNYLLILSVPMIKANLGLDEGIAYSIQDRNGTLVCSEGQN